MIAAACCTWLFAPGLELLSPFRVANAAKQLQIISYARAPNLLYRLLARRRSLRGAPP